MPVTVKKRHGAMFWIQEGNIMNTCDTCTHEYKEKPRGYISIASVEGNRISLQFDSKDTAQRMYDKIMELVGQELRK